MIAPLNAPHTSDEFRAQIARDNQRKADELAKRAAEALTDDGLVRLRDECLYWTQFRFCEDDESEAVFQASNRHRLEAYELDIRRRRARLERASLESEGRRSTQGRENLIEVVRLVKEILTVPDALVDLGFEPKRTGSSHGRDEWHSRCPLCGGIDRCISWGHPESNWACRQCRAGGDVVDLAETVLQVGFPEATRRLARLAGIAA